MIAAAVAAQLLMFRRPQAGDETAAGSAPYKLRRRRLVTNAPRADEYALGSEDSP